MALAIVMGLLAWTQRTCKVHTDAKKDEGNFASIITAVIFMWYFRHDVRLPLIKKYKSFIP